MRRRLAAVTLATASLIVVSFLIPLGLLVRRQAEDRALARAESDARAVATALAVASSFGGATLEPDVVAAVLGAYGAAEGLGVFLADGSVVGDGQAGDPDVTVAASGVAYTARTDDGAAVLVPVVTPDGILVVRVEVSDAVLTEGVAWAWLILALLGGLLLAVAVAAADRLGRSMVTPVEALRRSASALAEGRLDTRVNPGGPPEVAEVGRAFNELADRLGDLLQAEREAAADVSHGLRTPVAALRLQVESIADPILRETLLGDVRRLEGAVDAVITEARSRGDEEPHHSNLDRLVATRSEFWRVLAEDQGRAFEVSIPVSAVEVRCAASAVTSVVDNLLENVFAHTAPEASLRVSVANRPPTLTVEDGGEGFDRDSVERGVTSAGSTGLGLDIVRRVAERSGGRIEVGRSDLGGAKVIVYFGAP